MVRNNAVVTHSKAHGRGESTHYFSANQTSVAKDRFLTLHARGVVMKFVTQSGMFSPLKIDLGSLLLTEEAIVPKGSRVLDLGCGYGVVGITLAKADPSLKVVLTDVNERAVACAQRNVGLNSVSVNVRKGDGFESVPEIFDSILLNPPQSAGKVVCERLIRESKEHLENSGTLQLVARHHKGGRALGEFMRSVFGNVSTGGKQSGYRIYYSKNSQVHLSSD